MIRDVLVLAVDVGTTNIKAGVVDQSGKLINITHKEVVVDRDNSGKAEHDPEALFKAFIDVCRIASQGLGNEIKALVVSSYQFSILPVDGNMRPLTGIMTLLDTRPQSTFPELHALIDDRRLYQSTGCPPLFQYPISKIFWLRKTKPALFDKASYFLGSKDYLIYRIIGEACTDASLASSTSLMNIETLNWDPYPLQIVGIARDQLPQIVSSEAMVGKIPDSMAVQLGLHSDVQLITGVYDGGAVGIGLGCMEGSTGIINLGTTAMLRAATEAPVIDSSGDMRLQTCYLTCKKWFPGGGINNAGIVLKWLKDNMQAASYDELIEEASGVESTEGLFCLPFLTGERNPNIGNCASGMFFGIRPYHKRAHFIRAALEGVSYMLRTIYDALLDNNINPSVIRAGGGGSRSDFWMGMIASMLGVPVQLSSVGEPALLGSAMVAYTTMDIYESIEQASNTMGRYGRMFYPLEKDCCMYDRNYSFFRELLTMVGDMYSEHAKRGF